MLAKMRRRGPDGARHEVAGPCAIGQCLLATTPEDGLSVPPVRLGSLLVVADARLDNRDELLERLELADTSICDTGLIAHAYRRWGDGVAAKLLGDFAFIVWDAVERRLVAARDPLAVRPLYYSVLPNSFVAGSTMQALFAAPGVTRAPAHEQLALFIEHEYEENGFTLYRDVHALPAAHTLIVTPRRLRLECFWRPDPWRRLPRGDDQAHAEQLAEVFREAVRCRLRSSRPLGAHLSGGLDSSSVVAQTEQLRREGHGPQPKPTALHLEYPGMPCDEGTYSGAVSARWQLPVVNALALASVDKTRPRVLHEDPDIYYDPRLCMWAPLFKAAQDRGIRTLLTGEGGDLCLRQTYADLAGELRQRRVGVVLHHTGLGRRPWSPRAWRRAWYLAVRPLVPPSVVATARALARRKPPPTLLTDHYAARVGAFRLERSVTGEYPDAVTATLCRGVESSLIHLLHALYDRVAAAHGMEYRHPFLDRRLIELLLAMPPTQRHAIGQVKSKPVLRRAMRRLLPPRVLHRSDTAEYSCYTRKVLFEQHQAVLSGLFDDSRLVEARIIPPGVARAIARGSDCNSLIHVIGMEIWLRTTSN